MPDLYTRLSTEARPFEIAVGQMIEQNSSYQYIQDKTHMDYDVYLKHPDGQHLTVEVKVHAGASKYKKYDTACLEIKEYQYKHGRYVKSHWLKSDFKIMAHVDREDRMVHFYNGSLIRQWALDRKCTQGQANIRSTIQRALKSKSTNTNTDDMSNHIGSRVTSRLWRTWTEKIGWFTSTMVAL